MDNKIFQMTKVAELYYERNLSQREIGDMLELSRSMVSRLLSDAREAGIVTISIKRPIEKNDALSETLRKKFGLREVIVIPTASSYDDTLKLAGAATAELLQNILVDNTILGVSWGRTLFETMQSLPVLPLNGVQVVQLSGGLGEGNPANDGPELALRFAEKLNGRCRYLHAPAMVEDETIRDQLLQQSQIRLTVERAAQAQILLTGIGSLADNLSSLNRAGYLSEAERQSCLATGAVGHLLARMIDIDGAEIDHRFNRRVVSVPLSLLQQAGWSIGVAVSSAKGPAVLGAIRGGYFNTLILDEAVALAVLNSVDK
jgi:DNA-binding transcriptional regulator LsrR (DeoR family)